MRTELAAARSNVSSNGRWVLLLRGVASLLLGVLLVVDLPRSFAKLVVFLGVYCVLSGICDLVSPFGHRANGRWNRVPCARLSSRGGAPAARPRPAVYSGWPCCRWASALGSRATHLRVRHGWCRSGPWHPRRDQCAARRRLGHGHRRREKQRVWSDSARAVPDRTAAGRGFGGEKRPPAWRATDLAVADPRRASIG
jgi:hypothetical protein